MTWFVKCDESCIGGGPHKFLVVSGIAISNKNYSALCDGIDRWRETANMRAELKWSKVSSKKLTEYKQFVNGGMRWINNRDMAFRSVLFRKADIRLRQFHDASEELGLHRFTYELVLHALVPRIPGGEPIVVQLDKRTLENPRSLDDLHRTLNCGIRKQYGHQRNRVQRVEQLDSKKCNILQINDVLMGAVQHQNNDRHLEPGSRPEKTALAEHVAEKAGLSHLRLNTPRRMTHFGIWMFRFSKTVGCSA